MGWMLLLIGSATAAVFIAVPFIRWDIRRTMHRMHQQAVETLTREEDAAEGLSQSLHAIESQLAHARARAKRLGAARASNYEFTQSCIHPIYDPGGSHGRGGSYGPGPPYQS
jgi:hypothetical protein